MIYTVRIDQKKSTPVCVNHEEYEFTAVVKIYESLFLIFIVLVIWLCITLGYVMLIINKSDDRKNL